MSWSSEEAYRIGRWVGIGVVLMAGFLRWAWAADPKDLAEQAKARAAQTPIDIKPAEYSDVERVKETAAAGLRRGREEFERRAQEVRAEHAAAVAKNQPATPETGTPAADKPTAPLPGRVVVALSSSMPQEMLREYMRQLDRVPAGITVLRGFIGGAHKVGPTGLWVEQIRRKTPSCRECPHYQVELVVDPLLYRDLKIDKVPAVAYLPGVQDLSHCDAKVLEAATVVYGAVSIKAALNKMNDAKPTVPRELIAQFGGV